LAIEHKLLEVNIEEGLSEKVTKALRGAHFVKGSAVTFIWVAVTYRKTWRYGERGYRSIFLDAGHVCQNLYLSAEAIKCGVCAIGAFNDDEINDIIGINGVDQFVIYIATLGAR
jgi:SagB-type dehydrogenase family enzyme